MAAETHNSSAGVPDPLHPDWAAYERPAQLPPPLINDPALPLVSIVTPSFNQGRFLAETINSVLAQDYPNLEYWVIDGGSSDETLAVLRSFAADKRLHWLSEPDRGQSDAINKGWRRCRGAILAWLNSDDTYLPGAVKTQVAALQRHAACGAVYGDAQYVNSQGQPVGVVYGRPFSRLGLVRLELPIQPTVFLRREVCAQAGPLRCDFNYGLDTEYWLRVSRLAPWHYEPALIATYRLHAHSKTVEHRQAFYADWLRSAALFFADPALSAAERAARGYVIADIYSAMANLEAQNGTFHTSVRYLGWAWAAGGLRPRMLKWLPSLLERRLPFRFTPLLTTGWTWWHSRAQQSRGAGILTACKIPHSAALAP